MGLAWLALAGMLVMGGLAAGLKKVNCIAVILIEFFSVIIWDCLLYGCEYGATCNASKAEGRNMMLNATG